MFSIKYQSNTLNDLLNNDLVLIDRFDNYIKQQYVPNLILVGPPSSGKTSIVKFLIDNFYSIYKDRGVFNLDLSDDTLSTCIDVNLVKFCKQSLIYPKDTDTTKLFKTKLVIFDDADNLEQKIQPRISAIMDEYKKNVNFIFICNSTNNLLETIQNKCIILRISKPSSDYIKKKLISISKYENINCEEDIYDKIIMYSNNDIRHALNIFSIAFLKYGRNLNSEQIEELFDIPSQIKILNILNNVLENNLKNAINLLCDIKNSGFTCTDILSHMCITLNSELSSHINTKDKIRLLNSIHSTIYDLSISNLDSLIQLVKCVSNMIK